MSKKSIFFFLIFITSYYTYSQKSQTTLVKYSRVINNPTGVSFATPYQLYCNAQFSFYEQMGEAQRVKKKTETRMGPNGEMVSDNIMKSSLPYDYYYTNTESNTLIFRETVVDKSLVVKDSVEAIPWSLYNEHKKIGEYNCQKATAQYRGRKYTVWFTTQIPIASGPWKLRGLPGLIFEVTEETGKYEFHATEIQLNPDQKIIKEKLKQPKAKDIVQMNVYIKALKNKAKNQRAMILASLPRGAKLLEGCDECPDPNNRSLERFE